MKSELLQSLALLLLGVTPTQDAPASGETEPKYETLELQDSRRRFGGDYPLRLSIKAPIEMTETDVGSVSVKIEAIDISVTPARSVEYSLERDATVQLVASRCEIKPQEGRTLKKGDKLPHEMTWSVAPQSAGRFELLLDFQDWREMANLIVDGLMRPMGKVTKDGQRQIVVSSNRPCVSIPMEVLTASGRSRASHEATKEARESVKSLQIPQAVGALVAVGGLVFAVVRWKRRRSSPAPTEAKKQRTLRAVHESKRKSAPR